MPAHPKVAPDESDPLGRFLPVTWSADRQRLALLGGGEPGRKRVKTSPAASSTSSSVMPATSSIAFGPAATRSPT